MPDVAMDGAIPPSSGRSLPCIDVALVLNASSASGVLSICKIDPSNCNALRIDATERCAPGRASGSSGDATCSIRSSHVQQVGRSPVGRMLRAVVGAVRSEQSHHETLLASVVFVGLVQMFQKLGASSLFFSNWRRSMVNSDSSALPRAPNTISGTTPVP